MTTHLSDILVPDSADLLDVGGSLGNILQRVTEEVELVLDVGGGNDFYTGVSDDTADVLLTEEVSVQKHVSSVSFQNIRNPHYCHFARSASPFHFERIGGIGISHSCASSYEEKKSTGLLRIVQHT